MQVVEKLGKRPPRSVPRRPATATADGTVYMAIGGGVASSGTSAEGARRADMLWSDVEQLQIAMQLDHATLTEYLTVSIEGTVREGKITEFTVSAVEASKP
jgi:hypothetical protein